MNICIIFSSMVLLCIFIKILDHLHKSDMMEKFSEQKRFADKLIEIVEEDEEEEEEEDVDREIPPVIIESCDCPVTKFTTFKADYISSDRTANVRFGSDVSMGKASVNELIINDIPFARFDSNDNKIVIG